MEAISDIKGAAEISKELAREDEEKGRYLTAIVQYQRAKDLRSGQGYLVEELSEKINELRKKIGLSDKK